MSEIILDHINKYYGTNHVLKDVSFTVHDGDFLTLLGPSGCGKTTMLRVIAGLENPQGGTIVIDGKETVNAENAFYLPPSKRGLNLVFQSYALWPHMTVHDNVAFVLEVKKLPKKTIDEKVAHALERMQIGEFSERYPSELSGGQQQRVAIARAIVSEPKLLLLDEPLSNLDAKLRIDMRGELKRLHKDLGTTVVYVTHDQVEALTMSTRIAVFFNGVLSQIDTPVNVYSNPSSVKVADFIGNPKINFVEAKATYGDGTMSTTSDLGIMEFSKGCHEDIKEKKEEVLLGIRPEQIDIKEDGAIKGVIKNCQPAGSETLVQVDVGSSSLLMKTIGISDLAPGDQVALDIKADNVNVFDKASGALIKDSIMMKRRFQ